MPLPPLTQTCGCDGQFYADDSTMPQSCHILVNGLSIGSGGGYTVGRELLRHLAKERRNWQFTIALIAGHKLHEQIRREQLPDNCDVEWAPSSALSRLPRARYERGGLSRWVRANGVNAALHLNGMVVPSFGVPALCHHQDPWPYRPEAWNGPQDRLVALLKRRAHRRALQSADYVGWTSHYLRDLICGWLGVQPRRSAVFYNGLPDSWLPRGTSLLSNWESRPLELLSVSNVDKYKRQELVIRALPGLLKRPGLEHVMYRIVGHCPEDYRAHLERFAGSLGVSKHVRIEGRVSDERVQELYRRAKCFVLMSVCESFGIPAIEAMSFGVPVIVSDCCAMPEVCGDAAVLSPTDDVSALVDNIAGILQLPDRATELRERGTQRVQRFSWAVTAAAMAAALGEIASHRQEGA